nr:MAG TPA: hypothetical protein [Caudoviricetes sp.]DAJ92059.1 MAG TPA: hypothetical protein [Caudoviricetes sp.]
MVFAPTNMGILRRLEYCYIGRNCFFFLVII